MELVKILKGKDIIEKYNNIVSILKKYESTNKKYIMSQKWRDNYIGEENIEDIEYSIYNYSEWIEIEGHEKYNGIGEEYIKEIRNIYSPKDKEVYIVRYSWIDFNEAYIRKDIKEELIVGKIDEEDIIKNNDNADIIEILKPNEKIDIEYY